METIIISQWWDNINKHQVWMSTSYIDGEPNPEHVDLFGTATLPTPWFVPTAKQDVIDRLRILNPDAIVQ